MVTNLIHSGTKQPPHDIDSEEALLGAILIDGLCIGKVINRIQAGDFYSERHQYVYNACVELYNRREGINQITVAVELARLNKLDSVGGAAYLSHCINVCPTSLDVQLYADIVYRLSISRKLIEVSEQLAGIGYQSLPDPDDILSKSLDLFKKFHTESISNSSSLITPVKAGNDILSMVDRYAEPQHVPSWGFRDLDQITAGIYPEYIIIGARPSIGKTQLMLDISENVLDQGKTILFVSAEMNKEQIYERKLSRRCNINILDLRKYGLNDMQRDELIDLSGEISEKNLYLLTGGVYLKDIYREISIMLEKGSLDAVFIDYLGSLRDCYTDTRESLNVRISRISNKIQDMVHQFNVPFIVASQLNRELEETNRKPQLSDLRDSGSIEQDADVVFLLHREKEDGILSNTLYVAMAKNRQLGMSKAIKLLFNSNLHRYVDYTERPEEGIDER